MTGWMVKKTMKKPKKKKKERGERYIYKKREKERKGRRGHITEKKKGEKRWSYGLMVFGVFLYYGFLWVFLWWFSLGFSGVSFLTFFRSFLFYGVTFKDLGDNKNSGEEVVSTGSLSGFWFLVSGFVFWFSGGVFILALLGGVYTFI